MASKSLAEQEKDIRDNLRRAERTPVRTSVLRKDTLRRLIDLAHSHHPSLKIIAATNLKLFIKDFPDLEDEAINAVYDLCEDPASSVRIKGYAAIVDVSREQQKWVKRNADVLVQLLQSDEPEEVTVVKRALTQHLDMDPAVTLGVLCDQIVPPDEPLDEEEQNIRDRLRSLVLAFLAGEAKRPLVERHANTPGTPADEVLVSGLLKAVTKLSPNDTDVIVKDILASLPSFKPPSRRGKELLDVLLAQARATLKTDLPSGGETGSLRNTRYYLDLASFVAVDRRMAHPSILLRFYYTHLTPKLVLVRLHEGDRAYVIRRVAETFAIVDESTQAPPTGPAAERTDVGADTADIAALRKQYPEISSVLLQVFADIKSSKVRPWVACQMLVQDIARRAKDGRWQLPQHIVSSLRRIESLSAPEDGPREATAAQEQVHSVIRSLLEPIKSTAGPATQATSSTTVGAGDAQKGNVHHTNASGTANGADHDGMADAATGQGDQRRIMNVNKRKLDAPAGPSPVSPLIPSSSRVSASPRALRHGLPSPPASLPSRPMTASSSNDFGAPSAPRADRQRERQGPPHFRDRPAPSSKPDGRPSGDNADRGSGMTPSRPEPSQADDGPSRASKRARTEGRKGGRGDGTAVGSPATPDKGNAAPAASAPSAKSGSVPAPSGASDAKSTPSLLSRLATGALNGKALATPTPEREEQGKGRRGRSGSEREWGSTDSAVPAKRRAEPSTPSTAPAPATSGGAAARASAVRGRQSQPSPDPDKAPVGGYSIRGAAKAANRSPPPGAENAGSKGPASLLQRLQPVGGGGAGADEGGGRRGRKRMRHA